MQRLVSAYTITRRHLRNSMRSTTGAATFARLGRPRASHSRRSSSAASASIWFQDAGLLLSQRWAARNSWQPTSQRTSGNGDRHLREHKSFANFAEGDAFRRLVQCSLEALDRLTKAFGAETERLMMDRHDEMSAGFIGHLHGLFRSTVRMNPGIVRADRHDRQIDGTESAQPLK